MFRRHLIAGLLFLATAHAEEAGVPSAVAPSAKDCAGRFAQIGGKAEGGTGKSLRGALARPKSRSVSEGYDRLSQAKVEDYFPLDTRPGGQLSIGPRGLQQFGDFLNDYRKSLASRLADLGPGTKHYLGNARLSEFRQWLKSNSRNGEIPLADYNAELTMLVKEYKAQGKEMNLEQLADWLFLRKFLPAHYNAAPADVLQYLQELPPEMSALLIERAKNVARVSGATLGTTVKNGLTYGLITVVASAVIARVANAPIQRAVNGVIDRTSSVVEHVVTDPLGEQKEKTSQAFIDTLKAMKAWESQASSQNADGSLIFEETQGNIQQKLPVVFAALSKDLQVKDDAIKFEKQLGEKIKVAQAQIIPTQEALDVSRQKISDWTAALKKLQQPAGPAPVDPTAPTAESLRSSIAEEQKKAKTLQDQLAAIMTDWLVARYIHSPTQPGYPDNKESDFPDATKKAYQALYQNFMTNDHGLRVSSLIQPAMAELNTLATMTKSSDFFNKAEVDQQIGTWP